MFESVSKERSEKTSEHIIEFLFESERQRIRVGRESPSRERSCRSEQKFERFLMWKKYNYPMLFLPSYIINKKFTNCEEDIMSRKSYCKSYDIKISEK